MKRVLRSFATGLLIGGLVGLWFGMNIGKDQPLLSNPLADVPLAQQAGRSAQEAAESAREGVEQAGETVSEELDGQ